MNPGESVSRTQIPPPNAPAYRHPLYTDSYSRRYGGFTHPLRTPLFAHLSYVGSCLLLESPNAHTSCLKVLVKESFNEAGTRVVLPAQS